MPDKIMIAGESSFIAKLGVGDLRNGINMYRHSQAAPVDFEIADHDWAMWGKAAAAPDTPNLREELDKKLRSIGRRIGTGYGGHKNSFA